MVETPPRAFLGSPKGRGCVESRKGHMKKWNSKDEPSKVEASQLNNRYTDHFPTIGPIPIAASIPPKQTSARGAPQRVGRGKHLCLSFLRHARHAVRPSGQGTSGGGKIRTC